MELMVVDDDTVLVEQVHLYLEREGHKVQTAHSAEEALQLLEEREQPPQVMITDIRMATMSGLELVDKVHKRWPETFILVMTGYGTIEVAVDTMRRGAYDFITKPFRTTVINSKLKQIDKELNLRRELTATTPAPRELPLLPEAMEWLEEKVADRPLLVISPRSASTFTTRSGLKNIEHVWLTHDHVDHALPPGHLYSLLSKVEEFVKSHYSGLVYLEGIALLSRLHGWPAIQSLMVKLYELMKSSGHYLLIGLAENELAPEQRERLLQAVTEELVLSVSRSLAHEARLTILDFIAKTGRTPFHQILKDLKFSNSAALSFHLKQMVEAGILEHPEQGFYQLTPQGHAAVEALVYLREAGMADTSRPVALLTLDASWE